MFKRTFAVYSLMFDYYSLGFKDVSLLIEFILEIILNKLSMFLVWFGVIFVRQGFYKEAVFRFNILLPDKFPDDKTVPVSAEWKLTFRDYNKIFFF